MKQLLFLLFMPLMLMAQVGTSEYEIKATLKGLANNTTVSLINGITGQTIATASAQNGQFILKGKLKHPELVQIGFAGRKEVLDMFIDNDAVVLDGEMLKLNEAVIMGSATQKDYERFKVKFNPIKDKLNSLASVINQSTQPGKRDSLITIFNQYKAIVLADAANYVKTNPKSPVSPFVLFAISPLYENIEELEARYNELQPIAQKGFYSETVAKMISDAKVGRIGSQAIDFTQNDVNGKPVKLSSFKGKYVLVDFWASWCKPCEEEAAALETAWQMYKGKGIVFVGVDFYDQEPAARRYLEKFKITYPNGPDLGGTASKRYGTRAVPETFFISPEGKIIGCRKEGPVSDAELRQRIAEIMPR